MPAMRVMKNLLLCLFLGLKPREAEKYSWTDFAALLCGRYENVITNEALQQIMVRYLR